MEKVVLLDTSVGSTNKGDEIIMRCVREELAEILNKYYTLTIPTHVRSFGISQCLGNLPDTASEVAEAKYKFICGTNLLSSNMFHRTNQWDINLLNIRPMVSSVLVGVGGASTANYYTKHLYTKILSHELIHSVRDRNAYKLISALGLKCVYTGCVTMWKLMPEFCKQIKATKSPNVVFTLTDYNRDPEKDRVMIDVIRTNYKKVYFWIQGVHDFEYLHSLLIDCGDIEIIPADVEAYRKVLSGGGY